MRLSRALGSRSASVADYQSVFEEVVSGIISDATKTTSERREFTFRFYGGWIDSVGDPTDLHNMLVQCINRHRKTYRQSRIIFEVAMSPIFLNGMRLEATLRTEPWRRPDGRVTPDATCGKTGATGRCAEISQLNLWLKGKCPAGDCSARLCNVAGRQGQKIVDTLIVADSITASATSIYDRIIVLSADDDMIPGVLYATGNRGKVSLARFNYSAGTGRYDTLLSSNGIVIHDI